jgi:hypothetical protein
VSHISHATVIALATADREIIWMTLDRIRPDATRVESRPLALGDEVAASDRVHELVEALLSVSPLTLHVQVDPFVRRLHRSGTKVADDGIAREYDG